MEELYENDSQDNDNDDDNSQDGSQSLFNKPRPMPVKYSFLYHNVFCII